MKHLLSLLAILRIAFLDKMSLGVEMCPDALSGLYFAILITIELIFRKFHPDEFLFTPIRRFKVLFVLICINMQANQFNNRCQSNGNKYSSVFYTTQTDQYLVLLSILTWRSNLTNTKSENIWKSEK